MMRLERLDKPLMALMPTLEEQELLADTFVQARKGMTRTELRAALALAAAYAFALAGIWMANPPHGPPSGAAILCTIVLALATRVRFDTPFGFTVPTQLAFVPLLFAAGPALTPILTLLALALAGLPDLVRGQAHPSRLVHTTSNAWFAIGPAAVFAFSATSPERAGALLLVAALAAQFAVDFSASAVREWLSRGASFAMQLRETWVYVVDAALSGVGLVVAEHVNGEPLAVFSLVPLLGLLALFAHERHYRLESLLELNNAYRGTALLLGDVVEADDGYTGKHCKGVVGLALEVADELGLELERRRNLEFGALLHDVGKIAIPKEIITKPGKLDPEEWSIIKTHTVQGQKMLERVGGFMRDVGAIVRSHHERWDGDGYPDGLRGEAIPLEARIISCCDAWNAMRTDRPYRKALSEDVARAELRCNSGTQFDPRVVEALFAVVSRSDGQAASDEDEAPLQAVESQPVPELTVRVRAVEPAPALEAIPEEVVAAGTGAREVPAPPVATQPAAEPLAGA